MYCKKYLLLVLLMLPMFFLNAEESKGYVETEIEVNDMLLKYHCYKTQGEFDRDFYSFIIENTLYKSEALLKSDYLQYGTFKVNTNLSEDVQKLMKNNGFLYTVTCYTKEVNEQVYTVVIINKMVNGKFYLVGWSRTNESMLY